MVFLGIVLVVSVAGDCRNYRIPNQIILFGLATGLVCRLRNEQAAGFLSWLWGVSLPVVLLGVLFLIKAIGAGDIKLFSVIGGFLGPQFVVRTIVTAFLIGGLLSVIQLVRYRNLTNRLQYLAKFISDYFRKNEPGSYYVSARDGRSCVIHFTIAIIAAVPLCLVFTELGSIL